MTNDLQDFTLKDGRGGELITGADKFVSKNFEKEPAGPGVLSMVNSGNGAKGSVLYLYNEDRLVIWKTSSLSTRGTRYRCWQGHGECFFSRWNNNYATMLVTTVDCSRIISFFLLNFLLFTTKAHYMY